VLIVKVMSEVAKKAMSEDVRKPHKNRYYFFLNPYEDAAFTRCPKCESPTKLRKIALAIHIEPRQLVFINKLCRYCTKCELIIAKKSKLESLMVSCCERMNPDVVGNDYITVGTVSHKDWLDVKKAAIDNSEAAKHICIFKNILNFELVPGGWYPDNRKRRRIWANKRRLAVRN